VLKKQPFLDQRRQLHLAARLHEDQPVREHRVPHNLRKEVKSLSASAYQHVRWTKTHV
jgi:hypothetical protein